MISINHFGGGKAAKDYFTEHLSKGDYYAKDAELLQPRFDGLTADILGIRGHAVTQDAFFNLVDNKHPLTGEQLTARMKLDRRSMTDVTFDVPKSVTLAHMVDPRVNAAVDRSIDETMAEMEKAICVRVRKGGKDHDRETGNLLYVKWPHETTRPLADSTVDPHCHVHVTVLNMSYDPVEKQFKATQFGNIVRDKGYYQAAFHSRLGDKLTKLGYGVEREGKGFRLLGIDKTMTEKFSRRTSVIEARAAELGITNPDAKADLGRKTRNRKSNELGSDELKREWLSRLSPSELKALKAAGTGIHKPRTVSAKEAVDHAIEHSFERKSVITQKNLLAAALVQGVGSVTVEGVHGQIAKTDLIRKEKGGTQYVTTKAVYQEELAVIAFARDGRGTSQKLAAYVPDEALSLEQNRAMRQMLDSRDRVIGLSGRAGTGKTTLLKATVAAIEAGGTGVNAFAPSADASRGVLRSEGFENADTLERLLTDKNLQREVAGRVLLIDEAGLMGARDMNRLFKLAEGNNNRIILSGDTKQNRSVARGDALRVIEKESGLKFAELREVHRQTNAAYREAVKAIAKDDFEGGMKKLEDSGAVVEIQGDGRYQRIADDYLKAIGERKWNGQQKSALVVAPTHAEAAKVTARIREGLKAEKRLAGKEQTLSTLYSTQWTVAERNDPLNYEPGLIVQFDQNVKGFRRGDRAEVTERTVEGATVKYGGKECRLPLDQAARFQVYRKSTLPVAAGETIRITKNGRITCAGAERKLDNGTLYKVAGFTDKGDLRLSNGFVVPKNYGHIAHGYTATSQSSQGKTLDKVYISMSEDSLSAANRENFYVAISRGREAVTLYTDHKKALFEAVQKSGARMSATELLGERKPAQIVELNRVRRAYQAIKERTQEVIKTVRGHERKRA